MTSGTFFRTALVSAYRRVSRPELATLAAGADKVTGQTVFDAARRGDPTARGLFGQIGYWLGVGIASVVNLLDIEIVVIGGGLISAGELLLAPARDSFRGLVFGRSRRPLPALVPARFGPDAGVVGAATLALDQRHLHRSAPNGPSGSEDAVSGADQHLLLRIREDAPCRTHDSVVVTGPQHSNISVANQVSGSQAGSQQPQAQGRASAS